jgi:transcription initiation factor IIF auxiliary subunit
VNGRLLRLAAGLLAALTLATATSALAALTVKNTSSYTGGGRWDWRVFVDADAETLRQIECVEYTLHPTFPNPVRTVCSRSDRFLLTARGWGTFEIKIKVLLTDDSMYPLSHPLTFR